MTPARRVTRNRQRWVGSVNANSKNVEKNPELNSVHNDEQYSLPTDNNTADAGPLLLLRTTSTETDDRGYRDDAAMSYDCDDDTSVSISPRSLSSPSTSKSTTKQQQQLAVVSATIATPKEIMEESKMQVDFCEMTAEEMNQIVDWWSNTAADADDGDDDDEVNYNTTTIQNDENSPRPQSLLPVLLSDDLSLRVMDQDSDDTSAEEHDLDDDGKDQESVLPRNSLAYCDTPLSPPTKSKCFVVPLFSPSAPWATNTATTNLMQRLNEDEEEELPLPHTLSLFSPFRGAASFFFRGDKSASDWQPATSGKNGFGDEDSMDCFDFDTSGTDPNETFATAREQQEQITCLIFTTQDMADQVTFLTETSGTDEDDDDLVVFANTRSSCRNGDWTTIPATLLNRPRNVKSILRRRHHKKTNATDIMSIRPTASEDSTCSWMQLDWQDHGRVWIWKQFLALETTIVSKCLVPVLPLPWLLYLMHRPRVFRYLLCATFLGFLFMLPLLTWCWFPARSATTSAPLPNLQPFLQHPYHESDLHYSLQESAFCDQDYSVAAALDVSEARNHDESIRI